MIISYKSLILNLPHSIYTETRAILSRLWDLGLCNFNSWSLTV